MPLHHVHGLIAAALSALSAGSSIHCCETFSPRSFDQALRDYAPTWLTAAPALHIAMSDYYAGQNSTPSIRTLRCFRSSSAPLPPASIARLEELYAAPLLETYGLTETASTLCSNRLPPGKRKPGSVGQAIGADLKIVDPEGRELPAGQDGEVILKGPGVISEYVGTQPADAFIDGDLAHRRHRTRRRRRLFVHRWSIERGHQERRALSLSAGDRQRIARPSGCRRGGDVFDPSPDPRRGRSRRHSAESRFRCTSVKHP